MHLDCKCAGTAHLKAGYFVAGVTETVQAKDNDPGRNFLHDRISPDNLGFPLFSDDFGVTFYVHINDDYVKVHPQFQSRAFAAAE